MSESANDRAARMIQEALFPSEFQVNAAPAAQVDPLIEEHGRDAIRKALGLYKAALACVMAGGTVTLKDVNGKEKTWRPK